jgi:hypothetical protein
MKDLTIGYECGFEIRGVNLQELLLHGDPKNVKVVLATILRLADRATVGATGTVVLDVAAKKRPRGRREAVSEAARRGWMVVK